MQLLGTLAVAALAVTAQAGNHLRQRHPHFRRADNSTVHPTEPMTTSTVYATSVVTITSCAPSVTSCPAESTALSTIVVAVSTTVCPVSEVTGHSSPGSAGPTVPGTASTANPVPTTPPVGTGVKPSPYLNHTTTIVKAEETDKTLTYTLGAGESTTVVTTTIRVQSTRVETVSVFVTPSSVVDAEGQTPAAETPAGSPAVKYGVGMDTIESTSTQFITVSAMPVGAGQGSPAGASNTANAGGSPAQQTGGGASCPAPSTVTVTTKEMVTVTVTPEASKVHPTLSSAPYHNGTDNKPTSHVASTGFITLSTGSPVPSKQAHNYYRS